MNTTGSTNTLYIAAVVTHKKKLAFIVTVNVDYTRWPLLKIGKRRLRTMNLDPNPLYHLNQEDVLLIK